jgi:NADH:ubiquinone oxidoreductase subunit 5 (subunit L)/multisubunit Na+/H+ antiporter MnhA subunit
LFARILPASWWPTLYAFALSEGYLKDILKVGLWFPLRRLGAALQRWHVLVLVAAACALATGMAAALVVVAVAFSASGLALWRQPARAVVWISASSLLVLIAAVLGTGDDAAVAVLWYGGGIAVACALGCAGFAAAALPDGTATRFAGRWGPRPIASFVAFMGALGLAGVPLWPTFWGEDLIVHTALGGSRALAVAISAVLAVNGYLGVRNFAYTFMGRVA